MRLRDRAPLSGFRMRIPVRFSECDLYEVVWHGHYAVYLEEIRNAICARYGWTVRRAKEAGFLLPVTRLELEYRAPARVDSTVTVVARLREPAVARFVLDYEIRGADGKLLTTASTEQVVTRVDGELLLTLPDFLGGLCADILRGQDDPAQQELTLSPHGKMQETGSSPP
jgi:acyl-CoA thioester hydrolase